MKTKLLKVKPIKAKAKFIKKKQLAENVFEFWFKMVNPVELEYISGQYLTLIINPKIKRQYSIATSPLLSKKNFSLIVDLKPQGSGTKYLSNLEKGAEISFIGQMGLFVLPENISSKLYFIATGTGIAPLKAMIETLVSKKVYINKEMNLIFGTRTLNDIIYENIFNRYVGERKLSTYEIYISREKLKPYVKYNAGRVTDYVKSLPKLNIQDAQFFLCGSGNMIKSVEGILKQKEISETNVFYERYY